MKYFLALFCFTFLIIGCSSDDEAPKENEVIQCLTDSDELIFANIQSQEELEVFAQLGYRNIPNARISIRNATDLSPLKCLIEVGELDIRALEATSFEGLNKLEKVCILNLSGNVNIQNFEGFNNLRELDELTIRNNNSLMNMEGFDNLQRVHVLIISENPLLEDLVGLESLQTTGYLNDQGLIEGTMAINNNASMTTLRGLENLSDPMGYLIIGSMDNLRALTTFNNVTQMGGFRLTNSPLMTSIDGFNTLIDGGAMSFGANLGLETAHFPSMTMASVLDINECPNFNSLQGFAELTELYGLNGDFTMQIDDVPSLTSLDGFENLGYTKGFVTINNIGDTNITNMCALELLVTNYLAQSDDIIMFPFDNEIDVYSVCTGGQDFLIDFAGTCDCN